MPVDGHFPQEGETNVVTLSRDSKTNGVPEQIPEYVIYTRISCEIILNSWKRKKNSEMSFLIRSRYDEQILSILYKEIKSQY